MKKLILSKKQILFFIAAGALSAVIEIFLMKIFSTYIPTIFPRETNFHGFAYPLSNILSTGGAILFNYFMSIWFVFKRGKYSKRREFVYFISFSVFSTIISLSIFQLLFHYVFLAPIDFGFFALSNIILSKATAIIIVSILNYMVKKRFILKNK